MDKVDKWELLIVDDTPDNLVVIGAMLHAEGYRISFAQSGIEALELLGLRTFDLVLTDIRMPGMDGIELCRRAAQNPVTKDIPILFISAIEDKEEIAAAFEAGGRDYILKPVDKLELIARVGSQIAILSGQRRLKELNSDLERRVEEKTAYLEKTLHERTLLLQEVYHRVNNNLQFIESLLVLDQPRITDPLVGSFFHKFESRIHSLALVHEMLYQAANLREVDMARYAREIFHMSGKAQAPQTKGCELNIINEAFSLEINHAIPCGLVLNEIIQVAVDHCSLPLDSRGRIMMKFSKNDEMYRIDIGFGGALSSREDTVPQGNDLMIVQGLIESQLSGTIDFTQEDFPRISINFPKVKLCTFNDISSLHGPSPVP